MEQTHNIYLQSFGAAETVTGSKHILDTPELKILIDCGLFQGIKSLREKNWESPEFDPATIDVMILTHAHLDHCGYIPLLIKNGYKGQIFMSAPTKELTEIILRDSAKIQEEDAQRANDMGYSKHAPAKPLYTTRDVELALPHFSVLDTATTHQLSKNISCEFFPAGHIPGACSVQLLCYGKSIVFSGDIGRYSSELLPAPSHPAAADYIIMESTYGDRLHDTTPIDDELAAVINETLYHKGNVLLPCFAVGRAQDVIHILYQLKKHKQIPSTVPVFLDSPMAASASKVLTHYPDWITISAKECLQMFSGVTINQDHQNTQKIIAQKESKIILAASGMMTGGRVLEYLKHYLSDSRNTILIMGFQAEGTRGRTLLNGAHELKMHGRYFPVKARIKEIGGLSAHADQAELLRWLKEFTIHKPKVFLVHGEPCALDTFRVKIKDELNLQATIVKQGQRILLFSSSS